ncbi:serine integrase family protein [Acetivibrio mesophilus]|uniref:Recombinase n=1 Tax=Acetivibrio mesophilus TaxID=2487273 RepID=A0A4Q0I8T7_9FIRM|nr:recombinase [Acetivibrio mesophilus]RXE60437.1 recombinase [Acetivibrio mesophilus]
MAHTPYGYIIKNGIAVIDDRSANQVKELFHAYLSGLSLADAAKRAGIKRCHSSIAKMLTCKRYLGDAFYPPIIDEDTFKQAEAEKIKRAWMLGRIREQVEPKNSLVRMRFSAPSPETLYEDPFTQAEYAYSLIESEVIADGQS